MNRALETRTVVQSSETRSPLKDEEGEASSGTILRAEKLAKDYQTPAGVVHALVDVDLEVDSGEFLGIVGKSGAGKSTLVNLLSGIDYPTSGNIFVARQNLNRMKQSELDRFRGQNIGVVFQFFQLLPSLNLVENITLAMDFCQSYPLKDQEARALELLDRVGIVEHAYKIPSKISGGQQQRVAIARALANNPRLLIADEPTGNLDSHTTHGILQLFASLVDEGKSVVLVSHDKTISHWTTRVIQIKEGTVQSSSQRQRGRASGMPSIMRNPEWGFDEI
jgi:putative ABC transport system ATP-binding protein